VGSCTDLVATVSYPLRRIYGDEFIVAPLTVLVDPVRAMRVLDIEPGRRFSSTVRYVYQKQLEEADVIVINKIDLLDDERCRHLRDALASRFPDTRILEVSARVGTGLEPWFDYITSAEMGTGRILDVDYEIYAEGEARLGWLNCTADLASDHDVDAGAILTDLSVAVQKQLNTAGVEVAHLKISLAPAGGVNEIALVSLVGGDFVPELTHELDAPVRRGQVIVNLRAEAPPELLRRVLTDTVAIVKSRNSLAFEIEHVESFKPGKPVPTHRVMTTE